MDYIKKIHNLPKIKDLLFKLKDSAHALLLVSKDELFLKNFAKLIVLNQFCNSQNEICFDCTNCKKILNGNAVDVQYYGFDKPVLVEDSQQIISESYVVPMEFAEKFFIVNDINNATIPAQNKLLKIIEEPQNFDRYIFLTTQPDAVLPTIKSRCQKIVLPKFSADELTSLFKYNLNDAKHFMAAVGYANGNLSTLIQIYDDQNFMDLYNLTLNMLTNMRNSSMVLDYSSKILAYKGQFDKFLQILSSFYADLLCIKNNKTSYISNKQIEAQLQVLANSYSQIAITKILNYINIIMQRSTYNTNLNGLVDSLLLKILEIKYICN